jgi:hypothetical protein
MAARKVAFDTPNCAICYDCNPPHFGHSGRMAVVLKADWHLCDTSGRKRQVSKRPIAGVDRQCP